MEEWPQKKKDRMWNNCIGRDISVTSIKHDTAFFLLIRSKSRGAGATTANSIAFYWSIEVEIASTRRNPNLGRIEFNACEEEREREESSS